MNPPTKERPSPSVQRWLAPGICLALAAITFAVFGQTTGFGFINDDDSVYVYENATVAGGLSLRGLAWVFTHLDCHFYHPLTMLSLMGDYQLHGLHAGGYHVTNVLLHAASVILLFLVLREMTGAIWPSAFVAAVFAIHPLRVESVAWVAERKDVLGTFFFMLTLGAYVHYVRKPDSLMRYLMVMVTFALGLLSKPTMVTLPFVLLLLDYWPLHRFEQSQKLSRLILEKVPLLALATAASALAVRAEGKAALATLDHISMVSRFGNALVSYAVYLGQMIWPDGLAPFYPLPKEGYPIWMTGLSFLVLALISSVILIFHRKRRWLLVGWLWYLGMLMPMIGLVQVGAFAHADRMTYLPQIGLYVAVAWLVEEWGAKRPAVRRPVAALMAGVIAALMLCAWKQTAYWKNNETLWNHTLDCTTSNYIAHYSLALDLVQKGEMEEATAHFQKALQFNPAFADARLNLGNVFFHAGRMDEAILQFQQMLQIVPNFAEAHNNLALAFFQKGSVDEAIAHFQKALQLNPDYAEAHYSLGTAFLQKGRTDDAITEYQDALKIKPGYPEAQSNLGNLLAQKGKPDEAIAHLQKALQIEPANPTIQNSLAWLLATCPQASLRNGPKAVELAQQADAMSRGTNPLILHTLAAAFAESGQFGDAMFSIKKAIALAHAAGRENMVEHLNGELKRYEAGLPLHQ